MHVNDHQASDKQFARPRRGSALSHLSLISGCHRGLNEICASLEFYTI